jgi:hypothetical protein
MTKRAFLILLAVLLVPYAVAQGATKQGVFAFSGSATAGGNFNVKIVARGADCSAAAIFSVTTAYDAVAGGAVPTTAQEIRDVVQQGLDAVAPGGYTVESIDVGNPGIRITADIPPAQNFDVCVDGVKILGDGVTGTHTENGVSVFGVAKAKGSEQVPEFSAIGMILMVLMLAAIAAIVMLRRQQTAA